MAGPRQKRKQRSSRSKVKTGTTGRTKAGKKKINFLGNETIAQNWDRKLTLVQNYERLGLSVRLNAPTGGTEKAASGRDDIFTIKPGPKTTQVKPAEIQVERDPETGRILRVIKPDGPSNNPLNDPLNDIMDTDEDEEEEFIAKSSHPIVAQLESQAKQEMEDITSKRQLRQQSTREEEWIEKLVAKHGDDYAAMFRDRRLNVMQQSEGDIKRRIKKWKQKHGG